MKILEEVQERFARMELGTKVAGNKMRSWDHSPGRWVKRCKIQRVQDSVNREIGRRVKKQMAYI